MNFYSIDARFEKHACIVPLLKHVDYGNTFEILLRF